MPDWSILLDALAPARCVECGVALGAGAETFCAACDQRLPRWRSADGCPRCGTLATAPRSDAPEPTDTVFEGCVGCLAEGSGLHVCHTLLRYRGSIRRWIPGFKRARGPFGPSIPLRRAIDGLARELARRVSTETRTRPDRVVGVPLHPRRLRRRGFNHVDPIAYRIARELDRPWVPDALVRVRDTPAQAGLVGAERRRNVRGAFRATRHLGDAAVVWLIDDVLTTGSTLEAAADALLDAGVVEVRALTLAATLPTRWAIGRRAAYHAAPSFDRYP